MSAAEEAQAQVKKLQSELEESQKFRLETQTLIQAEYKKQLEEYKATVQKLQADNNRLRTSRDSALNDHNVAKNSNQKFSMFISGLKATNAVQKASSSSFGYCFIDSYRCSFRIA